VPQQRRIGRKRFSDQGHEALVEIPLNRGSGQALINRAVAGFAVYVRMLAHVLLLRHIRVTSLAGLVPRKLGRMLGNLAHRRSAIVPILSKAFWDDEMARHKEDQKREDE